MGNLNYKTNGVIYLLDYRYTELFRETQEYNLLADLFKLFLKNGEIIDSLSSQYDNRIVDCKIKTNSVFIGQPNYDIVKLNIKTNFIINQKQYFLAYF